MRAPFTEKRRELMISCTEEINCRMGGITTTQSPRFEHGEE